MICPERGLHNKLKRLKMKDINRQLNLPTSESVYDTISILMNSGTLPLVGMNLAQAHM